MQERHQDEEVLQTREGALSRPTDPRGGSPDDPAHARHDASAGAAGSRAVLRIPGEVAVERALTRLLYLVMVPVAVLVLSALGAFVYGTAVFVDAVGKTVSHPFPVGNKIGLFLLVVDLFLVGATLLIAAFGFYELFIGRVDEGTGFQRLPLWLQMRDLNDLKARVIAMIVLVGAVSFVEVLVDGPAARDLLELGGGVSLVIVALTVFLRFGYQGHGRE